MGRSPAARRWHRRSDGPQGRPPRVPAWPYRRCRAQRVARRPGDLSRMAARDTTRYNRGWRANLAEGVCVEGQPTGLKAGVQGVSTEAPSPAAPMRRMSEGALKPQGGRKVGRYL